MHVNDMISAHMKIHDWYPSHLAWLAGNGVIHADLQGANPVQAKLSYANLEEASLQGANLQGANLEWVSLQGANLEGASLQGANLEGANLRGANLKDANLKEARLSCADLRGSDLRGSDLRGADLFRANLIGADLRGAKISRANIQSANLQGVRLQGVELPQDIPVVNDIHKAVLEAVTGSGIDISSWRSKFDATHCRAGWVVTLAGQAGQWLESDLGTGAAAALIYYASDPDLHQVPEWYVPNDVAIADIKRLAGVSA